MIKKALQEILSQALLKAFPNIPFEIHLEKPADSKFGDFASNVAMTLTKVLKKNPREIAQTIIDSIDDPNSLIKSTEIAGPGFLNFKLYPKHWVHALQDIYQKRENYGKADSFRGKKALVEFVSANPTGPLHVGHGRNAVVGDTIANLLRAVGYEAHKEYYVNDGGIQMRTLGLSVLLRYQELQGRHVDFPEQAYQGEYIKEIAEALLQNNDEYSHKTDEELIEIFGQLAGDQILNEIKQDLKNVGIIFDEFFFESTLYKDDQVEAVLDEMKKRELTYEKDDALWLSSMQFGDDKDRVLKKSDGNFTYLTPDIAYHQNKYQRGYDLLVNVLGADHAGYGARLKAALQGLGHDPQNLSIAFIQMVSLIKAGELISMSTRRAQYETLESVTKEVGSDVARYFFMMRSYQSQLEFDVELAKTQSQDNPVFYVQYAHARICSIFAKARDLYSWAEEWQGIDAVQESKLDLPEEILLMSQLLEYPELILQAALDLAPHRVTTYVLDLARQFQSYYDKARSDVRYKIVTEDEAATRAKLYLIGCVRQILKNGLDILGVSAPIKM